MINFTSQEIEALKVALLRMAKSDDINDNSMKFLLVLRDKVDKLGETKKVPKLEKAKKK